MTLETLEFLRLLPAFMRGDGAARGLAGAMDSTVPPLAERASALSTWDAIGALPDAELDELAWELNITWYDSGADAATKRELIKNSDLVRSRFGTPWAVEELTRAYFGGGKAVEWFEYGGEPGHFRIYSDNIDLTNALYKPFLSKLDKVKRVSQWLDEIRIPQTGTVSAHYAVNSSVYERDSYDLDITPVYTFTARTALNMGVYERYDLYTHTHT